MHHLYRSLFALLVLVGVTASAFAQAIETEPNDFFKTATTITDMNFMLAASFSGPNDVDIFKLTLEEGYMYHITSSHSATGLTVKSELYFWSGASRDTTVSADRTLSGNIIRGSVDGRANSGDFRLANWVTPPELGTGTYYLRLFPDPSSTPGTYNLRIFRTRISDFVEANEKDNNPTEALIKYATFQVPTDGTLHRGMLFNPDSSYQYAQSGNPANPGIHGMLTRVGGDDRDWFVFAGEQGQRVELRSMSPYGTQFDNLGNPDTGHNRDSDTAARMWDADLTTELAYNDDKDAEDGEDYDASDLYPYLVIESLPYTGLYYMEYSNLYGSGFDGNRIGNSDSDPDRGEYMFSLMVGARDAEVEPNNSAAEATSIIARNLHKNRPSEKETYAGQFSSEGDVDWYRIALFTEFMYYFNTFNSSVSQNIKVELYSADDLGTNLIDNTVEGRYSNRNFRLTGFVPPKNGVYLLKLSLPGGGLADGATGAYNLRAVMSLISKSGAYDRSFEPNNTFSQSDANAELRNDSTVVTSMLWPKGDKDIFYYDATAGEVLKIETLPVDPNFVRDLDTYLTVYDAAGNKVAENDDASGSPSGWVYAGLKNFTVPADGRYYFEVTALYNGVNDSPSTHGNNEVGLYKLYMKSSAAGAPITEIEPNDTFENATELLDGQTILASHSSATDVDIFRVSLKKGYMYHFRSQENTFGGAAQVDLFRASDLANGLHDGSNWNDRWGGNNFRVVSIVPEEDEDYYLQVRATAGSAGGDYKVSMRSTYIADLVNKLEPNNTVQEAHANGPYPIDGMPRTYVLYNPNDPKGNNDADIYRVDLVAGQAMVAETKPVGGSNWSRETDTYLQILGADGNVIAGDDDGGEDWYSRIGYVASEDVTIYVRVLTSRHELRGSTATDRDPARGDYILVISGRMTESEPNNTPDQATAMPVNDNNLMEASFSADDLVDWFSATLQAGRMYYINTAESNVSANIQVEVYAASNTNTNLIDNTPFGRYNSNDFLLGFNPPADGTYLFKLSVPPTAIVGASSAYKFRIGGGDITLAEIAEIGEPNNTRAEADAIGNVLADADSVYFRTGFHVNEDVDIYRFEGRAGSRAVVESFPTNGPRWVRDFDTIVRILDRDGNVLGENDDKSDPVSRELFDISNIYSRVQINALPYTGAYYAQVIAYNGAANEGTPTFGRPSTGAFDLAISVNAELGTSIDEDSDKPMEYALHQNYPNPFNPSTSIKFEIPAAGNVKLTVYNILGQPVMTLVDGFRHAGAHVVNFNASRLASGVYLYRLEAGKFVKVQKMTLIK